MPEVSWKEMSGLVQSHPWRSRYLQISLFWLLPAVILSSASVSDDTASLDVREPRGNRLSLLQTVVRERDLGICIRIERMPGCCLSTHHRSSVGLCAFSFSRPFCLWPLFASRTQQWRSTKSRRRPPSFFSRWIIMVMARLSRLRL